MAQEADGSELPTKLVARRGQSPAPDKLPRGSSPADTLISPRLWKHVVVGVACLLAWSAVLVIGVRADRAQVGLETIVGLSSGKLTTFFSTVMLLAAGQLAFINLWYRSRSRKDFNGSYKLWFWAALGWLTFCAVRASGAHWSLADAALGGRPVAVWNGRLILWMIPTAISFSTLYLLLRREMRDCRESLWTLRLAAGAALLNGLTLLFGPFVLESSRLLVTETALGMAWHMLLAYSMLLHARHVIHVSNEPPQSDIRRFSWSQLFGLLTLRRGGGLRKSKAVQTASVAEDSDKPARSRKVTRKKRTSSRRPITASEAATTAAAEDESSDPDGEDAELEDATTFDAPVEPTRSQPVATAGSKPVPSAPIRRVDPPQSRPTSQAKPHAIAPVKEMDDEVDADATTWNDESDNKDDDDQNLSRKERKRLMKLQRQQSRTGR